MIPHSVLKDSSLDWASRDAVLPIPEAGWLAIAADLSNLWQILPSADMRPLLSGMSEIACCSAGLPEAGWHV